MHAKSGHFSHVRLFATMWTIAQHAPLSMGFLRQEYWSGLPCSPPGDLPNPGIEPTSLKSPASAGRLFTATCQPVSFHLDSIPAVFLGSRYFHPARSSSPGHSEGAQCLWEGIREDRLPGWQRVLIVNIFPEHSLSTFYGAHVCFLNIYMILLNPHKNLSYKDISIDHIARSGRSGTGIWSYWTPKSTPFLWQHPSFLGALDKKLRITWRACEKHTGAPTPAVSL